MGNLAQDQAQTVQTEIHAAVVKMTAAATLVEDKAADAKDGANHARATMLDSLHDAANSLSAAVTAGRVALAKAIAPKQTL